MPIINAFFFFKKFTFPFLKGKKEEFFLF